MWILGLLGYLPVMKAKYDVDIIACNASSNNGESPVQEQPAPINFRTDFTYCGSKLLVNIVDVKLHQG